MSMYSGGNTPSGTSAALNYLGNTPAGQVNPPTYNLGGDTPGFGAAQQHGGLFGTGQNTLGGAASQALGGGGKNIGQILGGALSGAGGASGAAGAMGGALAF
jgi:hypothetical protein